MPQDLTAVPWPVRTERLVIRMATPDDVEPTWQFRRLPAVPEWLTVLPTDRADYAAKFLDTERLTRTLLLERDGVVVGDMMLFVKDAWAQAEVADRAVGVQAELGWVITPAQAGQGLATEAAGAALRICFQQLGLRRVFAQCFAANVPSWRVMEKVGMRREQHTVRESLHRSGEWLDGLMYAILAEEWRDAVVGSAQPADVAKIGQPISVRQAFSSGVSPGPTR
jgi:RimJ/RimL family protein N-acetyltransferase